MLLEMKILNFWKNERFAIDGMDCGAPVLHMRGLCIDLRAMQQEHSYAVLGVIAFSFLAIPMGAFVSDL